MEYSTKIDQIQHSLKDSEQINVLIPSSKHCISSEH